MNDDFQAHLDRLDQALRVEYLHDRERHLAGDQSDAHAGLAITKCYGLDPTLGRPLGHPHPPSVDVSKQGNRVDERGDVAVSRATNRVLDATR